MSSTNMRCSLKIRGVIYQFAEKNLNAQNRPKKGPKLKIFFCLFILGTMTFYEKKISHFTIPLNSMSPNLAPFCRDMFIFRYTFLIDFILFIYSECRRKVDLYIKFRLALYDNKKKQFGRDCRMEKMSKVSVCIKRLIEENGLFAFNPLPWVKLRGDDQK